ncbi:MAG: hypothetical protein QXY32_07510, partial [Nitrososphaerota archaeon]
SIMLSGFPMQIKVSTNKFSKISIKSNDIGVTFVDEGLNVSSIIMIPITFLGEHVEFNVEVYAKEPYIKNYQTIIQIRIINTPATIILLTIPIIIILNHFKTRRVKPSKIVEEVVTPRIVVMKEDNKVYMTYNAFGPDGLRVGLTSIPMDDFVNRRWNWREEKIISKPNEVHKNFVLFPEKIDGRYAILHSISPRIRICYLDKLEFNDGEYIESHYTPYSNSNGWEERIKSPGAPPIKTDEGWLLFYHGLSKREPWKYKIGVMLLDLDKPEEVLYVSSFPVIEPDQHYEYTGFKPGVTYTCGAAIRDRELLVYYGAADTYVCVARTPLDEFLDALREDREFKERAGLGKLFINGFNGSNGS